MPMKRIHLHFPKQILEKMKALAAEKGIPVSELVRRALDDFLARNK